MGQAVYSSADQGRLATVLRDVRRNRGLFLELAWKDLRIRYRNAAMGFLWAVLYPLAMTLILYLVFSIIFPQRMEDAGGAVKPNYAVRILCALVPWQFFSTALTEATGALVAHESLIKKIYFPRELVPLSVMANAFVNLLIGLALVLVVYRAAVGPIGAGILAWPLLLTIQTAFMVGLALLFSCAHVYSRDVLFLVNVGLMFGFYASPILYDLEMVRAADLPAWVRAAYEWNPMAALLTAYRDALFDNHLPGIRLLALPIAAALTALATGIAVFRRASPTLADRL